MKSAGPVDVHGLQRLRTEYLERHPKGGDFAAFMERFDALREAVHGQHKPVRFYGLTFGGPDAQARAHGHDASKAHRRTTLGETGETGEEGVDSVDLPPGLPQDDAGRLALLQAAGVGTGATSLQEALADIELPFMFAGREQWLQNLARPDGQEGIDAKLQNVTMESVLDEPNALNLLLGRAHDAIENGRNMADDVAYWKSLVPDWAPRVRDQLASQGVPFSVELLASPELNLTDPSKPLFGASDTPSSLVGLGVHQRGERAFLRSLSAEELMTQLWPLYHQYFHRPAGSPPPPGFEAGMTFGSPVRNADGTFTRSPVMESEVYKRWAAYNQPGVEGGGVIRDTSLGLTWNPFTGEATVSGGGHSTAQQMLEQLLSGQIRKQHFPNGDWSQNVLDLVGSRAAAAAVLGDPSFYFAGPLSGYGPGGLDQTVKDRFAALTSSPAAA